MRKLTIDVVTPERAVARGVEVDSVVLPGAEGQMNILPGHVNLLTTLRGGTFAYQHNGAWTWAVLSGGFAEVVGDHMIVLAETLELQKELDKARAEEALKKAMTILKAAASDSPEYAEALAAKARAEARLVFAKDKTQH